MKNNLAVHMRYHLFLHYGWFLQNLGKDFIPSIMHTTVCMWKVCCVRRADVHFFPFINASPNLLFSPCHLKGFLLSENVLLFFPSFTRTTFACRNIIGKG